MATRWRVFRRILNENVFSSRALDKFTPLRKQKNSVPGQSREASSNACSLDSAKLLHIFSSLVSSTAANIRIGKTHRQDLLVGWPILGNLLQLSSSKIHEHLFKLTRSPKSCHMMTPLLRILNENVFSSRALDNFTPLLQAKGSLICVHGLLKKLYSASLSKNPVNIAEWVFITVANIISNLTCSKSLFEYTIKEGREMKQSLKELIKLLGMGNIADFFPLFKLFDPQGLKRRTLAIFQKYDALEIGINNTTKKEKGDMLDALLNTTEVKGQDFNLLPFGCGKRICVGWPLAHCVVHFYLAAFLHAFEWECPSGVVDNMEEFVGPKTTIQKAKSIIAIPKPRLSTSKKKSSKNGSLPSLHDHCFVTSCCIFFHLSSAPVGWRILGNLPQLRSSGINEFLFKLFKIRGPLFSLKIISKPVMMATTPKMARIILKQQEAVFFNNIATETSLVVSYEATSITFSPMGTGWRIHRRILKNILKMEWCFKEIEVHRIKKKSDKNEREAAENEERIS
ncbi:unnamed protein product [Malus baccata var. baccata]